MVLILTSCKNNSNTKNESIENVEQQTKIGEDKRELPTVNIKKNDRLISPTLVKVNSQGLWFASEGTLGFVQLIDEKGTELATGILTTKENWMSNEPVMFSTELIFTSKNSKSGILIIHNDPGQGDGEEAGKNISFKIPVTF
ncbi:hypothetical protein M667_13460 [Cellulophaga baltica NN016038]|nr:hypothetical protein M667_13460 [Cellulophaga baltica NN016038]